MERPHDYLRIVVAALPKDMNMSLSTQQRRLEFLTDAELTAIIRDSEQFLAAPKDEMTRVTIRDVLDQATIEAVLEPL